MGPTINILYGSQTGNAEDMAKRIGLKAKQLGYSILVKTMDDFPFKMLPKQEVIIFVCSTTGHGQEPENMKNSYNFIRRRDLPRTCLTNLRYAVYGLGDSSYAKFNYVSKILFKRLQGCGAKPLQGLVLGDEQMRLGCDAIIYPKLEELWRVLDDTFKVPRSLDTNTNLDEDSSYTVTMHNQPIDTPQPRYSFTMNFIRRYDIKAGCCAINKRMTPDSHFQDTRLIRIKTLDPIDYEPGDVCAILPQNTAENTDSFIKLLNLDSTQILSFKKKDPNYMVDYLYDFIPDGITLRELVRCYLDITSVPKRSFFEFFWPFSEDELERNKLQELASTEGQEELYEYCTLPKRNILEVLADFQKTASNIKFDYILDLIPPIKPRSFSIACSPSGHTKEVELIVGVVRYQTRMKKMREGLCSNYLAKLSTAADNYQSDERSNLMFFIKKTSFHLPDNNLTPIMMIGPGLGIAPFRGFLESRAVRLAHSNDTYLYFGCRFKNSDYYFQDELEKHYINGYCQIRVAFSREEPKQYVQNLLLKESDLVRSYLNDHEAIIYIAGNSKLPEDLRRLFIRILTTGNGNTTQEDEAEKLISNLESQLRIKYDCW